MKYLIIALLALALSACTVPDADGWTMQGTCEAESIGYEFKHNTKKDRTELYIWMNGGACEVEE